MGHSREITGQKNQKLVMGHTREITGIQFLWDHNIKEAVKQTNGHTRGEREYT